jgi:hypothetical protein
MLPEAGSPSGYSALQPSFSGDVIAAAIRGFF